MFYFISSCDGKRSMQRRESRIIDSKKRPGLTLELLAWDADSDSVDDLYASIKDASELCSLAPRED